MKSEIEIGNLPEVSGKIKESDSKFSGKAPKELFEIVSQVLTFIEIVDGNKKTD